MLSERSCKVDILYIVDVKARIICAIFILLLATELKSQAHIKEFHLDDENMHSISMPFELVSNLIILPLQVNGSSQMKMIFDSGVKTAILTEIHNSDTLPFTYSRVQVLQGLGEGSSILAYPSYGNTIKLDGITGRHQDIYVLGQNDINLSIRLGTPINGLIGYDLFKGFIVSIDYIDKIITFTDPQYYRASSDRRSVTMPIELDQGKPFIRGNIVQVNGDTMEVRLLLDTGGGFALWLSAESDSQIQIPSQGMRTYLGYGLGGEISGSIYRIPSLILGDYSFPLPTVAFPDSGAVQQVLKGNFRHGSVGAEVLRRFDIVFDYTGETVSFKPNANFSDDFTFNRTGLEVIAAVPGVNAYFVSRVQDESPAALAGLQVHDQILSINLRPASDCSMNDLNSFFHGKQGKRLKIKILRNGVKHIIRFPLSDPFIQP